MRVPKAQTPALGTPWAQGAANLSQLCPILPLPFPTLPALPHGAFPQIWVKMGILRARCSLPASPSSSLGLKKRTWINPDTSHPGPRHKKSRIRALPPARSSGSITSRGMGHFPCQPWALLVPREGTGSGDCHCSKGTENLGDPLETNHSGKEPSVGAESLERTLEERLGEILGMQTHRGTHGQGCTQGHSPGCSGLAVKG